MTFPLHLPGGLHHGEVRFNGDERYNPSSAEFTILAYKDSGFNITRDAYQFNNWAYTFDEHLMLFKKLQEKGPIDQSLKAPFILIFPILAAPGHCFGMAVSSSIYYINPMLKPAPKDTFAMAKEDAVWDIDFYQFLGYFVSASEVNVASALTEIKRLVNSGIPPIMGLAPSGVPHAITVIGYCEGPDETFLITYDSNSPCWTHVYSIKEGNLLYEWKDKPINISKVVIYNPKNFVGPIFSIDIEDALKRVFEKYCGIYIHCPVNVEISSENGMKLIITNNTVIRNDFSESYVYVSDNDKLVLLLANQTYSIKATGTGNGTTNIECVTYIGEQILTYQFGNIATYHNTKLYTPSLNSEIIYVDSDGDGIIDQEIHAVIINEFPSSTILSLAMLNTLIVAVLLKKRKKQKPNFPKFSVDFVCYEAYAFCVFHEGLINFENGEVEH